MLSKERSSWEINTVELSDALLKEIHKEVIVSEKEKRLSPAGSLKEFPK